MLKHYVTFLYPGSFFPEETTKEIKSRDEKFKVPDTCFAYEFWDREETEHNGETLVGNAKNKSGRFYFGEIMTEDDVRTKVDDNEILLSNMRINNWPHIVRTRRGNFQPLNENDVVITAENKI